MGDDVLAHVVGLAEGPVRWQWTMLPLACGYPAAEDIR